MTPQENNAEITVFEGYRQSIEKASYTPPEKEVLNALIDTMERRDISQSEVARQIKHGPRKNSVSPATINQLLKGTYNAKPGPIIQSIRTFINVQTGRDLFRDGGFVETRLYAHMEKLAHLAVTLKRITCIHGGIMCGKTINGEALHLRYDRAATVHVSCPRADSYGGFVKRLANILGVTTKGTVSDNREAILAALDDSHLLIIDNFDQPAVSFSYTGALRVYNFIAEINELCRCGVLLIGGTEGYDFLKTGVNMEHIGERISFGIDILDDGNDLRPGLGPNGDDDIVAICESFDLSTPTPTQIQRCRDMVKIRSASQLFDMLTLARAKAESVGERLTWDGVIAQNEAILKLN